MKIGFFSFGFGLAGFGASKGVGSRLAAVPKMRTGLSYRSTDLTTLEDSTEFSMDCTGISDSASSSLCLSSLLVVEAKVALACLFNSSSRGFLEEEYSNCTESIFSSCCSSAGEDIVGDMNRATRSEADTGAEEFDKCAAVGALVDPD